MKTPAKDQFTIKEAVPGTHGFYAMRQEDDMSRISIRKRSESGNSSSHVGYIHPDTGRAMVSNERLQGLLTQDMIKDVIDHFGNLQKA